MTTKQWFYVETINSLFDSPPTLKEVAAAMGSSHQKCKAGGYKTSGKGMLIVRKRQERCKSHQIENDRPSYDFWKRTDPKGSLFREKMFKEMDINDIARTRHLLEKLLSNLAEIENAVTDDENI